MAAHSSVIVWRIPGATVHGVSESAVAELPVRPGRAEPSAWAGPGQSWGC